jgi:hypothetical protein
MAFGCLKLSNIQAISAIGVRSGFSPTAVTNYMNSILFQRVELCFAEAGR